MPTLLILGAGGHGRVVADAALAAGKWATIVATDRDPSRCSGELIPGVQRRALQEAMRDAQAVHVAIGDATHREREAVALAAGKLATVLHPHATISFSASVGEGCFIAARAVLAPNARLGRSVIVNHGAVVDHDVQVGDFSHIAPLVALGGAVQVGRRVLVGSGASILPGVKIADDVVIGAGTTVTRDIVARGVYAGVPARRIQ